jgi:1-acyl-sn-glycerol-3-phosphate acyltransferase
VEVAQSQQHAPCRVAERAGERFSQGTSEQPQRRGGERDSLRPWTQRDQAVLAGRKGFVELAIRSGVPIVPISTIGGPDDTAYVDRMYNRVQASIPDGTNALARRRRLPLFG